MPFAYGYARSLAGKQVDATVEASSQKTAIEEFYESKLKPRGYAWGGVFVDTHASGRRHLHLRQAGGELCLRLEPGDVAVLARQIAAFRVEVDFFQQLSQWLEQGVDVHILDRSICFKSDDKDVIAMLSLLHGLFRQQHAERGREAGRKRQERKATGQQTNQFAGYGFQWVGPPGRKRRIEDAKERAIMQKIVQWKLDGHSWDNIASHLLLSGIRTRDGRVWSAQRCQRAFVAECRLQAKEGASQVRQ